MKYNIRDGVSDEVVQELSSRLIHRDPK